MRIHPAQTEDAEALSRLREDGDPPPENEPDFAAVRALDAQSPGQRQVACVGGEGGRRPRRPRLSAASRRCRDRPQGGSEELAYLTNVYAAGVVQPGRGQLAAALAAARDRSVDTVVVWLSERSVPPYRRAGVEPPTALLKLPIDPL